MLYTKIILQGKCYDTDTIFQQFPFISSKKFTIANFTILCENILKNKYIKYVFKSTCKQLKQSLKKYADRYL